jgi:hypothetical protein
MPLLTTAQSRIADLQAEIEMLKQTALLDLREKRVALAQQLHEVDSELARLTGKTLEKRTRGPGKAPVGRSIALQDLKELLAAAPEKTLNLRNAGLEVRNVKVLVHANPHLLRMGGKGAWPTVMLLK